LKRKLLGKQDLIFRGSSKHQICTKLFALPGMNWQVASGATFLLNPDLLGLRING